MDVFYYAMRLLVKVYKTQLLALVSRKEIMNEAVSQFLWLESTSRCPRLLTQIFGPFFAQAACTAK